MKGLESNPLKHSKISYLPHNLVQRLYHWNVLVLIAGCVSCARRDLGRGRGEILVPTATLGPPIFLVLPNTMSLCRSWIRRSLHQLFDGRGY